MNEEKIIEISKIERNARILEEEIGMIEMQIAELGAFKENLNALMKMKEKEMLASLGKRVYVKTLAEDTKKLFVEVGAGVVVRKTPEETIKIVDEQILRLEDARFEIIERLNEYQGQLQDFVREIREGEN